MSVPCHPVSHEPPPTEAWGIMRAFLQAADPMKTLLLILLCSCALAGCGQKGPLVQAPPAAQETQGNP
jgi:hypothetical protein